VRNVIPEKVTGSGRYSFDNSCRYDRYASSIAGRRRDCAFKNIEVHNFVLSRLHHSLTYANAHEGDAGGIPNCHTASNCLCPFTHSAIPSSRIRSFAAHISLPKDTLVIPSPPIAYPPCPPIYPRAEASHSASISPASSVSPQMSSHTHGPGLVKVA
jgi:hypothetical protein